jgi:hypothetical protein
MRNRIIYLVILLINSSGAAFAQSAENPSDYVEVRDQETAPSVSDSARKELKNNIYPGISLGLMWGSLTINYERKLFNLDESQQASAYLRAAYGNWGVWGASGNGLLLSLNCIPSKKPSHVELGLGAAMLIVKDLDNCAQPPEERMDDKNLTWFKPVFNLGYRYQHPYKNFLFRIGASFPEGAYMGLGVHF